MLQIQPHESHGADLSLVQPLRGIPPLMTPPTKSMYRGIALRLASLPDVRKPDVLDSYTLGNHGGCKLRLLARAFGILLCRAPQGAPGLHEGL